MLNSSCDAVCSFHLKNEEDHDNADFESDNHKPNLNNVPLKNENKKEEDHDNADFESDNHKPNLKNVEDHDNADFESDNHKPNLNHVDFKNDDFGSEPNLRDDTANMNSENLNSESLNNLNINNNNPTLTLKHHNPNLNHDNKNLEFEMCRRGCRSAGIKFLEAAREFAVSNVR
jgi:hypothetical protein